MLLDSELWLSWSHTEVSPFKALTRPAERRHLLDLVYLTVSQTGLTTAASLAGHTSGCSTGQEHGQAALHLPEVPR